MKILSSTILINHERTLELHGYNPNSLPDDSGLPVVLNCIVCGDEFELTAHSIRYASGRCKICRRNNVKKPTKQLVIRERSDEKVDYKDNRICPICSNPLKYGENIHCTSCEELLNRGRRYLRSHNHIS